MSEQLESLQMPHGQEIRMAYKEISNYNGREILRSISQPDNPNAIANRQGDDLHPSEECFAVLREIGLEIQLHTNENMVNEYRLDVQNVHVFTKYIRSIDTTQLNDDSTDLMLISAVLGNMAATLQDNGNIISNPDSDTQSAEKARTAIHTILDTFEDIDEALSFKRLNPPTMYEDVIETDPGHRFNGHQKKYQEAVRFMAPYAELSECLMARNSDSLQFNF